MDEPRELPTIADRLRWLLEIGGAWQPSPDSTADADQTWRLYGRGQVAAAIAAAIGTSQSGAESVIDSLLGGGAEDARALEVIAGIFGADLDYFGPDSERIAAAQDELLGGALRAVDVVTVIACRAVQLPPERRRELLMELLAVVRGRAVVAATGEQGDISNTPTSGPSRWHRGQRSGLLRSEQWGWAGAIEEGERTVSRLTARELRELCLRMLGDLDIVPPLEPELLCERLGEHRGRRIKLIAEEVFTTSSVGHLICKPRQDLIIYQRTAPRAQQAQVIYHEVIHLVRDHLDGSESLTCGALREDAEGTSYGLYSDWQEWEAETGATVLSELAGRPAHPRLISRRGSTPGDGLAASFGLTNDGGWRR